MDDTVTMLTFNLLAPAHAHWPRRRAVVRAGLDDLRPDVVALQECAWGAGYDQAADLLGPDYQVVRHAGRSADGVGAVLASRWGLGAAEEVDLHVTERVTLPWSAAVLAEVPLPPPIGPTLVVHHKPTWEIGYGTERELQAVACARRIEQRLAGGDRHVVVLGDFDDTPDSAALRFWTGRQSLDGVSVAYRDAWEAVHGGTPGHTFTPDDPLVRAGEMHLERGRRIDYVLVRCGVHGPTLDVADCRRVFDRPSGGTWASDHIGVLATLAPPPRALGRWSGR